MQEIKLIIDISLIDIILYLKEFFKIITIKLLKGLAMYNILL